MNVTKKIISFIAVVFIVIRIFAFSVSASFAAPFMAEETLKLLFIEALGATGSYSADDLESWEYDDLRSEFDIQMTTNPNFNAKKVLPLFISGDISDIPSSPEHIAKLEEEKKKYRKMIGNAVSDWFNSMYENGSDLYDFIHPTYTTTVDLKGHGALFEVWRSNGTINYRCYCDYISLNGSTTMLHGKLHYVYYDSHGKIQREEDRDMGDSFVGTSTASIDKHYGDVRNHWDGTQVETDDEAIPVIGEEDGTQVTPDMLNPDGTVTIDGTTYYPKDFIDWDKFKDPAIIDLLN